MVNRPKQIGTTAETATVRYVNLNGFPGAERLALKGNLDEGDLSFCPGVIGEVKGGKAAESASDMQATKWLVETEIERGNRGADVAVLIRKRKGKGAASAGLWWAYLPGWAFYYLAECAHLDITPGTGPPNAGHYYHHAWDTLPAVRITLAEACELLRNAGYGSPIPTESASP
jgi:hypothetical protein